MQVDLVDDQSLSDCSHSISSINSDASILQTRHSAVDIASLLNQGVYSQEAAPGRSSRIERQLKSSASSVPQQSADRVSGGSLETSHVGGPASNIPEVLHNSSSATASSQQFGAADSHSTEPSHTSRVSTVAIRPSGPVSLER